MKISKAGIDFIKKWEKFSPKVYICPAGIPTIGYGHTLTASRLNSPITEFEGERLLRMDVSIIEGQLSKHIKNIKLRQCQYDAIVSFCFNLGVGAFIKSNAYKEMLKDPDGKYIADSLITFRNAGGKYLRGLMRRRIEELELYYSW